MASMGKITLGIADDHDYIRNSFIKFIRSCYAHEIEVILEATNGSDLLTRLQFCKPEIILMDIQMPIMGGMEATLRVRDLYPTIKVIAFTQFDSESNIIEMNQLGVKSFLDKSVGMDEIIKAIRIVKDKGMYLPEAVEKIWGNYLVKLAKTRGNVKLDGKEREMLTMICQGMSSAEIGNAMHKSPRTVDEHRSNLCKKFGVANKEQLIALVSRDKII
jgi:two-component system, NarL family, response regulator DegU